MRTLRVVFRKELLDILRDWRALVLVCVVSIVAGPLLLLMVSNMLAGFEARAERRIIVVQGMEHAPSLATYLARETALVERAPADVEAAFLAGRLTDPVLVIPPGFEKGWLAGEPVSLTIITDSSNAKVQAGVARVKRWLNNFSAERSLLMIALRGVSPVANDIMTIEDHDISSARAQTAKIFGMLPYFLILAAIYGVWGAAIDTTAGERERGTLEPLMITPNSFYVICTGKWAAVTLVGIMISTLTILSFLLAQEMMRGETLRSMLAFGLRETLVCLMLVLPLTGLFAAVLMVAGAWAGTIRQAQAMATGIMLISTMLPLTMQLGDGVADKWQTWMPVIAQHAQIVALLSGAHVNLLQIFMLLLVCLMLSAIFLLATNIGMKCRID